MTCMVVKLNLLLVHTRAFCRAHPPAELCVCCLLIPSRNEWIRASRRTALTWVASVPSVPGMTWADLLRTRTTAGAFASGHSPVGCLTKVRDFEDNHDSRYAQCRLSLHWTALRLCHSLMRICVLFTQTLNRLEKPCGKDWRLIARLCCLPSAVRGTATIGHSKSCISDTVSASGLPPALGGYMVYLMGRPKSGGSRLWSLFQDRTVELANGFAMPPVLGRV